MSTLDRNAHELRTLVEDILHQFRVLDTAAAHGPHIDLSCQELRVVERLGDAGPHMMRELAEFLLLAVNSVTSTVDNLEKKGLVVRQRSQEDRRVVHVELTEAGRAAYAGAVGEKLALFRLSISAERQLGDGPRLEAGRWHTLGLAWDGTEGRCRVSVDGKEATVLTQANKGDGACYLRLRSAAAARDAPGFLVERASVDVTP